MTAVPTCCLSNTQVRALAVACHTPGLCLDGAAIAEQDTVCRKSATSVSMNGSSSTGESFMTDVDASGRRLLLDGTMDTYRCTENHGGMICASCVGDEGDSYVRIKGICVKCDGVNFGALIWQCFIYLLIAAHLTRKSLGKIKEGASTDIWLFLFQSLSLISKESNHFGILDKFANLVNVEPSQAIGGCTFKYGVFTEFFFKVLVIPS